MLLRVRGAWVPVLTSFLLLGFAAIAHAAVPVTLSAITSPSAGQAGLTSINVTGSGFPSGTIPPANITVTLRPSGSGASVMAAATAVTTVSGSVRRVTFQIPASVVVASPTIYNVSLAGANSIGTAFSSSNTSALTVNSAMQL